ncbi:MAG: prepilin-type N-terminal cleavage/methylation domain-containing protein [Verrucomicrobiales bacterium]|nr:prepilin-type N-terminal cleavage/methylation domain-containing protein [Verrucomicrobiales bacterium]
MKRSRKQPRRNEAGFSLFEIVVSMTILGIISSAVLSILWQAGDTASEIRDLDRNDEEVNRFLILLRESIENLPPEGTLAMTPASESTSGYDELVIGNSATAFTFGEKVGGSEETVIALRPALPGPNGESLFDLSISRADFGPDEESNGGMVFRAGPDDLMQADEEGRYWLPLMTGVTVASWRFWAEEQREWLDEWTDDEKMPPLLEFSLGGEFRPVPIRVVFNVPTQAVDPEAAAAAASAGSSATTTTSTGNNGGGGGQGGRGEGAGGRGEGGRGEGDRGGRGEGGRGENGGGRGEGGRGEGGPRGPGGRGEGGGRGPGGGGEGGRGGPGGGGGGGGQGPGGGGTGGGPAAGGGGGAGQ